MLSKLKYLGMAITVVKITLYILFIRACSENLKSTFCRFMSVVTSIERCRNLNFNLFKN